jgi:hypothetical protein
MGPAALPAQPCTCQRPPQRGSTQVLRPLRGPPPPPPPGCCRAMNCARSRGPQPQSAYDLAGAREVYSSLASDSSCSFL